MNSEKLYYQDQYLKEFTATVLDCRRDKKGYKIVLDRTAFYPEGGGQPCDTGTLTFVREGEEVTAEVTDVHEKGEVIFHTCQREIPVGRQVLGKIDWERRFDLMQQHTGDHIISGIIYKKFGYNNVGFHLSVRDLVIDYDGPLSKEDLAEIAREANRAVWENQPVTASYPEDLDSLDYRSKTRLTGDVRIVRRGDTDLCACCGTHVATTAQAGPIFILSSQNFNGGTRIFAACGKRRVEYMNRRNADCISASHILSSPVEKISSALENRMKELESLRGRLSSVKKQLIDIWAEATLVKDGLAVAVHRGLEASELQNFAIALSEKADTALCFSPDPSGRNKICIVSKTADTNKLGRYISSQFGGKGGGKPGIYQGFLEKSPTAQELEALCRGFSAEK